MNRRNVPVREGEEYDVEIEAVGEKGDGIAKVNGFVLFVPGTKKGDRVRVRVTKVFKTVGFGEVVGEAEAAPESLEEAPEEEPSEEPEEEPAEESEATEDFGEEPSEEPEDEPAEEPEEEKKEE